LHIIRLIVRYLETVSEWSGRIFSCFIISLIALSLYEVFTRRLLGKPTIWTHEIIAYLFCGAVLLTIGYTLRHNSHANVDIIYERLSPRIQAVLDLVSYTVFLGVFTVMLLYHSIIFAATSWAMLERTPSAFNFYVFPAKTLLPVGIFLLALQMISEMLKRIVFLVKGERL
jgi:TRAP-type mannitol/chloroaromatic compound transport system permease small subunit